MNHRLLAIALPVVLGLGSCGGGGGGDGGGCSVPGVLRALAVQGASAPGTAAGVFNAFTTLVAMDVAVGGRAVFRASTTDPVKTSVVYVADVDAALLPVFSVGDVAPDAGVQTITGFLDVPLRIVADGRILCAATLSGGGAGLFTARVDAGAVIEKDAAVLTGADMGATGVAGLLTSLNGPLCHLAEGGKVFFAGTTDSGLDGFWRVDPDGTDLDALAAQGFTAGGETILDVLGTAIASDGSRFAFAATLTPSGDEAVFSQAPADLVPAELGRDDDPLTGGGTLSDTFVPRPMVVYTDGRVVWQGQAGLEDVVLTNAPGDSLLELAREGDQAPQAVVGTLYGNLTLLSASPGTDFPKWSAELVGSPTSARAIFEATAGGPRVVVWDGAAAPGGGATYTETFPNLLDPPIPNLDRRVVSANGSLSFANVLSSGSSGMFWLVRDCGQFTLAAQGAPAPVPGGDTFGAFSPSAGWTAEDSVVVFWAPLTTAGSGLFRQGP